MKPLDLDSWEEFASAINQIRIDYGTHSSFYSGDSIGNDILFRGHAGCSWDLETTLERVTSVPYTAHDYYNLIGKCVNEIESVTGKAWHLPPYPTIIKQLDSAKDLHHLSLPNYDYLIYLRHHSFPSPLLDWTKSPYIAAYFAFEQDSDDDRCAIYTFIETPNGSKTHTGGSAKLQTMGPYVTTHERHFSQKAWYTVATRKRNTDTRHLFCSHHEIVDTDSDEQDVLFKITIPRSERRKALRELENYNINHYTLFRSEDALIRSLALRRFAH